MRLVVLILACGVMAAHGGERRATLQEIMQAALERLQTVQKEVVDRVNKITQALASNLAALQQGGRTQPPGTEQELTTPGGEQTEATTPAVATEEEQTQATTPEVVTEEEKTEASAEVTTEEQTEVTTPEEEKTEASAEVTTEEEQTELSTEATTPEVIGEEEQTKGLAEATTPVVMTEEQAGLDEAREEAEALSEATE